MDDERNTARDILIDRMNETIAGQKERLQTAYKTIEQLQARNADLEEALAAQIDVLTMREAHYTKVMQLRETEHAEALRVWQGLYAEAVSRLEAFSREPDLSPGQDPNSMPIKAA